MAEGRTSGSSESIDLKAVRHTHSAPEDAVRTELARVLASQEFRASRRCQEFLRFVVDHALSGHSDMLKERTIGIDVFGRPASYDPSDDATVRVKAGEVRKRLDRYYTLEGHADRVRIELPAGTYTPEFRVVTAADAPAGALHAVGAARPPRKWIYVVI